MEKNRTLSFFICHANEDKADIVQPLATALSALGLSVWYDSFSLRLGDSLRRSIDFGLASCDFGIVVLSPSFFGKEWPKVELDGLVAREIGERRKLILPVWHRISESEIRHFSPSLADKIGVSTEMGISSICDAILLASKDHARILAMFEELSRLNDEYYWYSYNAGYDDGYDVQPLYENEIAGVESRMAVLQKELAPYRHLPR